MSALFIGSESPAGFEVGGVGKVGGLGGPSSKMLQHIVSTSAEKACLSNEISAPYEFPQYPIEQIETKLIR